MPTTVQTDHSRKLCHVPNVAANTPREVVEKDGAFCQCCGAKMSIADPVSLGMQQLGMYVLVCPDCPPPFRLEDEP